MARLAWLGADHHVTVPSENETPRPPEPRLQEDLHSGISLLRQVQRGSDASQSDFLYGCFLHALWRDSAGDPGQRNPSSQVQQRFNLVTFQFKGEDPSTCLLVQEAEGHVHLLMTVWSMVPRRGPLL